MSDHKCFKVKDARAALDALREEEKERRRFEAEQAERIRQAQVTNIKATQSTAWVPENT